MNKLTKTLLFSCVIFATACSSGQKKTTIKLKSFQDSISWAIGEDLMSRSLQNGIALNQEILIEAIKNAADKKNALLFTDEERMAIFNATQQSKKEETSAKTNETANANRKAGQKYLEELTANDKTIKSTASGLYYKILKEGKGRHPNVNGRARLNYKGSLINGTVFDNSFTRDTPILLGVANVIPGIQEGIGLMQAGARYILYIPDHLAYGVNGNGEIGIESGMLLVYEVELYEVLD